ncbi:MAG: Ig-like domain-containing protein [Betaproteobacteria bacterium]
MGGSLRAGAAGLVLALALAAAGCGGGFYFNFSSGFDDVPPDVSLAAAATSAAPGQSVHLVAAASDDVGIDSVAFYRVDVRSDVLLGSDGGAPYEWDAVLPVDAVGSVSFFAIATDLDGNRTRSASITIGVVR